LLKIFFSKEFALTNNNNRTTTPILIEQSLFVVIT
jgi:hypothetical protein